MADEENVVEEEVDVTPGDKTKPIVILMVVLSVVVMVLTPIITLAVFNHVQPRSKLVAEPSVNDKTYDQKYEGLQMNPSGGGASRFAMVDVVISVNNPAMINYLKYKADDAPKGIGDKIQAKICTIISKKTVEELGAEHWEDLQRTIATEIETILKGREDIDESCKVIEVYFPKFILQ